MTIHEEARQFFEETRERMRVKLADCETEQCRSVANLRLALFDHAFGKAMVWLVVATNRLVLKLPRVWPFA